jgi:hypothetical protein
MPMFVVEVVKSFWECLASILADSSPVYIILDCRMLHTYPTVDDGDLYGKKIEICLTSFGDVFVYRCEVFKPFISRVVLSIESQ